jgi:hypothetical protein
MRPQPQKPISDSADKRSESGMATITDNQNEVKTAQIL